MSGAAGSSQWMYASGDYEIDQSLRFNDDDSAYLSKTFSSAGNRRTWTLSAWVKRSSNLGSIQYIYACTHTDDSIDFGSYFGANDRLYITDGVQGGGVLQTTQVFRDTSAWLHIVWALDTTQSTVNNRIKVYVNGAQVTDFANNAISSGISQNEEMAWMSADKEHRIGRRPLNNSSYLDGYIAEFNFVDGLVKAPADFGETGTYGEWKPIEYDGSYGTNGFYLSFAGGGVMSATGGNSTATDGDYKAASFTSNGTFTPSADGYVEYLVIAGGGAGGGGTSRYGAGGGAGGYRTGYLPVTASTAYSITVGAGGTGGSGNTPTKGGDSVFSTITSTGGGRGTRTSSGNNDYTSDINGGSGGGGGTYSQSGPGTGISGQGNNGGAGSSAAATGGGGGAGGAGGAAEAAGSEIGGLGGAGKASSITGSSVTRAGGGGGGGWLGTGHAGSAGGSGGGGRGNGHGNAGTDATANTGSGGGGGGYGHNGGYGGSGIVIIRYKFQ